MTITQGHKYSMGLLTVLALESGEQAIRVAVIDEDAPWPLQSPEWSHARLLKPMPMRYFHGEIPT